MPIPGLCHSNVRLVLDYTTKADSTTRFLGVDALWALCMSFNVYMALFCGWSAKRMRAQEWKYFVVCYGCSFIPAMAYLFVSNRSRGRVYGPALVSRIITPIFIALIGISSCGVGWIPNGTFFASLRSMVSFGQSFFILLLSALQVPNRSAGLRLLLLSSFTRWPSRLSGGIDKS